MRQATMLHIWTLRVIVGIMLVPAVINLVLGSDGATSVLFPIQAVSAWMAFQAAAFLSEVTS